MFVLDSSAAISLVLPAETSPASRRVAGALVDGAACAPAIWPLEVRNALLSALRSRRLTAASFDAALVDLDSLPVEIDGAPAGAPLVRTLEIARRLDLTVYDASYLELAERLRLPLATFDRALSKAAARLRVPVAG